MARFPAIRHSIYLCHYGCGNPVRHPDPPAGRRREAIGAALARTVRLFEGRILPFDQAAGECYAELAAAARAAGRGFPTPDGYIAAIAVSRGFSVAARDIAPFQAGGVPLIDPWSTPVASA